MASQMTPAIYDTLTVEVEAGPACRAAAARTCSARPVRRSGSPAGWWCIPAGRRGPGGEGGEQRASGRGGERQGRRPMDDEGARVGDESADRNRRPRRAISCSRPAMLSRVTLVAGQPLDLLRLLPEQHFTQPPPRYHRSHAGQGA